MIKRPGVILIILISVFLIYETVHAVKIEIRGKVINVASDDTITIDLGESQKLSKGMIGSVYYEMTIDDEKVIITIGQIELIEIGKLESNARIIEKTGDIAAGHLLLFSLDIPEGYGILQVISQPSQANVTLDDRDVGQTELVLNKVPSGIHTVGLSLKYHRPESKTVIVYPNDITKVDATLLRGKGNLLITSRPSGAEVWVGKNQGRTPFKFEQLPLDIYKVIVNAEGHYPYETQIELKDDETIILDLTLEKHAVLAVEVKPDGFISVDNGVESRSPIRLAGISPGKHTITARLPGYESKTEEVQINPGEVKNVSISLDRAKVSLNIITVPEGADVIIDDEVRGKTPLNLSDILSGKHKLNVNLKDYDPLEQIMVLESLENDISLVLQRSEGNITVKSSPTSADVYLDNKIQGSTPLEIKMPTGEYIIELRKQNYYSAFKSIELQRGQNSDVLIPLEPREINSVFSEEFVDTYANGKPRANTISAFPFLKYLGSERVYTSSLTLNFEPSSAKVYIDGKSPIELNSEDSVAYQSSAIGRLTFDNLAPGTHDLLVTNRGYNTRKKHVSIEPNSQENLNIKLRSRWKFFLSEMAFLTVVSAFGIAVYFIAR